MVHWTSEGVGRTPISTPVRKSEENRKIQAISGDPSARNRLNLPS